MDIHIKLNTEIKNGVVEASGVEVELETPMEFTAVDDLLAFQQRLLDQVREIITNGDLSVKGLPPSKVVKTRSVKKASAAPAPRREPPPPPKPTRKTKGRPLTEAEKEQRRVAMKAHWAKKKAEAAGETDEKDPRELSDEDIKGIRERFKNAKNDPRDY